MSLLVPTYQLKNESDQPLSLKADPAPLSPIHPSTASIVTIQARKMVEIERSRVDEEQVGNLRRKQVLLVTPLVRTVATPTPGGSSGGSL